MPTRETPTHSPAPFTVDRMGEVRDARDVVVASVHTTNHADERLFLKAPELLAACRAFVHAVESGDLMSMPWLQKGHSATMKALVDHIDTGE